MRAIGGKARDRGASAVEMALVLPLLLLLLGGIIDFGRLFSASSQLNQAARELMLLQSSDWAFIMKTGTTVEYAHKRTKDHVFRFSKLYEDIRSGSINENWLREVERRDNIFPEMDYRIYRS